MAQISESHYSFESASTDFDVAISPGASRYADLTVGGGNAGPLKSFITTIEMIGAQDLDYRLEFHKKSYSNVLNTASFFPPNLIGWVNLLGSTDNAPASWPSGAFAVATTYGTHFAWFLSGLSIPYEDRHPGTGQLHVNLVNQSGTAKNAGAAGYVYLRVGTVQAS